MPHRLVYRARVAFAVATAIVPAALVAVALLGYDYYHRERERLEQGSLATTRALAQAVDAELAGMRSALLALATSPSLDSGDLAAFQGQASAALAAQNVANFVLLGDGGHEQLVNTLRPFGPPQRTDEAERFAPVFARGEAVVTDLFLGPVARKPLVALAVPVARAGKVRYALAAGIEPARFAHLLRDQQLPPGWVGVILDRTGTVIARSSGADRFVGGKATPALASRIQQAEQDVVESTTLEGTPVLAVFTRAPQSGWAVAIGIPKATLVERLLFSVSRLLIVGFVLLLVALGLALLVGRRLSG